MTPDTFVNDETIVRVRCGIPDCEWGAHLNSRLKVSGVSEAYGLFWDHCVESHGLNPNRSELPGLKVAAFVCDLDSGGALTVNLTPAQTSA
jgi:hypothetical protein